MGKLWNGETWIDDRLKSFRWSLTLTGVSSKTPAAAVGGDNLLLENSDDLLTESGDLLLLE